MLSRQTFGLNQSFFKSLLSRSFLGGLASNGAYVACQQCHTVSDCSERVVRVQEDNLARQVWPSLQVAMSACQVLCEVVYSLEPLSACCTSNTCIVLQIPPMARVPYQKALTTGCFQWQLRATGGV